jgi:hypothetical protein
MISGMHGYLRGIIPAWFLFFIAARICFIVHHGFMPALEDGWWTAVIAAIVLGGLWPLPVLAIIALLVWILPPSRLSAHVQ